MRFRTQKWTGSRIVHALAARTLIVASAILLLGPAPRARAQVTIDFENNPSLPAQPDNFAAAGAMQTYTQAGVYTISGGVVLGNPTFLPAFAANGTPPNLYGTTDTADPSLQSTIELDLPAAENVKSVSLVLFNGQNVQEDYVIDTFIGGVPFPTPFTLDSTQNSGFANFSFTDFAPDPITEITVTTPNAATNGWDFFVDTIKLTAAPTQVVPEPSSLALMAAGLSLLGCYGWRRRKQTV